MSNTTNGFHATLTSAHVWAIIAVVAIFVFTLLWRVDKAVNNGMAHIYAAVQVTNRNVQTVNNNLRNLSTALKNHPGTSDLIYDWEDIPPRHGK